MRKAHRRGGVLTLTCQKKAHRREGVLASLVGKDGIRVKQSLTKELLYHIINRYVVLFLKIYRCRLN